MNPPDLGAPAAFSEWRPGQDDLLYRMLGCDRRFPVLDAPVGVGKGLVNVTYITSQRPARGAYLTSTRGLQDQSHRDFSVIGMVDARGMRNYPCLEWPGRQCDRGPCLDGGFCKIRFGGCLYYDAISEFRRADLGLTNYALWMSLGREGPKALGARDILILDEAHEAPEKLAEHLRIELDSETVNAAAWPLWAEVDHLAPWQEWAGREVKLAESDLADETPGTEAYRKLKRLVSDLQRLIAVGPTERWVWQKTRRGVSLEPVWAGPYAESSLFLGIPKIVLSSATIRPQTLKYLGVAPEQAEFISAPSPFPAARRPILWVKTTKVKWGMDPYNTRLWLDRIDEVIEGRLDRKGIIHPHSYDRAKYIKHASKWGAIMILPTRDSLRDDVARFKTMAPPAILISPAVDTGYDFPYESARYQIVAKMPFPPVQTDPILQLRASEDKTYPDWLVASSLQQIAGRVMRAEDDWGETIIVDDHIQWFMKTRREFFASWFREAYRAVDKVPAAPRWR